MATTTSRLELLIETLYKGEGTDKASKQMDALKGAAGAVAVTLGGVALASREAIEALQEGAAIQATADTFDSLSESIYTTEQALLQNLRNATSGVVDDLTLMSNANRFMAMGLADTADEVSELSRVAVQLGAAMGSGPAESMENFALLLANQSIPRLDSFGISSGVVRERIKELTTGVDALDKETAFMTAVMEQAQVTMDKVGDSSVGAAADIARMETAWKNANDAFKQSFAAETADELALMGENAEEAGKGMSVLAEMAGRTASQALLQFFDRAGATRALLVRLGMDSEETADSIDDVSEAVIEADRRLRNYNNTWTVGTDVQRNVYHSLEDSAEMLDFMARNARDAGQATDELIITAEDIAAAEARRTAITEDSAEALRRQEEATRAANQAMLESQQAFGEFFESALMGEKSLEDINLQFFQMAAAAGTPIDALETLAEKAGFTGDQINEALQFATVRSQMEDLQAAIVAGRISAEQAGGILDSLTAGEGGTAEDAIQAIERQKQATAEFGTIFTETDDTISTAIGNIMGNEEELGSTTDTLKDRFSELDTVTSGMSSTLEFAGESAIGMRERLQDVIPVAERLAAVLGTVASASAGVGSFDVGISGREAGGAAQEAFEGVGG